MVFQNIQPYNKHTTNVGSYVPENFFCLKKVKIFANVYINCHLYSKNT